MSHPSVTEGDGDEPRWVLAAGAYRLERLIAPLILNALSAGSSPPPEDWDVICRLGRVASELDKIHEELDPGGECRACIPREGKP